MTFKEQKATSKKAPKTVLNKAQKDAQKATLNRSPEISNADYLEDLVTTIEKHNTSRFEHLFIPALSVFSAIILGFFVVIYQITQDMSRLANSMDPNMGGNMSSMVNSISFLSNNVSRMTVSVAKMDRNFANMNENVASVAKKMDNLTKIASDLSQISIKMNALDAMVVNMEHINKNMSTMQESLHWMQRDLGRMRSSFSKPLRVFNSIPML